MLAMPFMKTVSFVISSEMCDDDPETPKIQPFRPVSRTRDGGWSISSGSFENFPARLADTRRRFRLEDIFPDLTPYIHRAMERFTPGSSTDDPHVVTADGLVFSTMTLGEFVYAHAAKDAAIELQVRHGRLPGFQPWASFNVAAAVRAGAHVYEVRLPEPGATRVVILQDGQPIGLPAGGYAMDGAWVTIAPDGSLEILAPEMNLGAELDGRPEAVSRVHIGRRPETQLIRADESEPLYSLAIELTTPPVGRYRGLFGVYDKKPENETTGRDGQVKDRVGDFVDAFTDAGAENGLVVLLVHNVSLLV